MSMKIVMTFRGDVICYQKGGEWKFIFPTDPLHDLKFSVNDGKPEPLRIANKIQTISIDKGTPLYPRVNENDTFSGLLNMSSDKMHGTTNGKSNLTERIDLKDEHELIFMSVAGGTPGRSVKTMKNYWVADQSTTNPETDLKHNVAQQVSLELELRDGVSLFLEIDGKNFATIPYQDGGLSYLDFDNHCSGNCKDPDDFLHYYHWLEDTAVTGRRFLAGKVPRMWSPEGTKSLGTVGNCDPVGSDPPPEP